MSRLELIGLAKSFGATTALAPVDLVVEDGEFLVLVGPSGCGKSTLLRLVAGLEAPSGGTIRLDGAAIDALEPGERDVAMVFQNYALYPHLSVRGNLEFPLRRRRTPRAEREERVARTAALLGLEPLLERRPHQLSGGQMQRVALGRALVRRPRVFLFDEPLSNLDAGLRHELRGELARLRRELGITSLYVTHDQAEAMTLGDRIAVFEAGRLLQVGPPLEVFARPAQAFVAGFIGSPPMNLWRVRVRAGRAAVGGFSVPCPGVEEGELVLGLRPHELEPVRAGRPAAAGEVRVPATVTAVEALGTQTLVECDLGDARLRASLDGPRDARVGQAVELRFALSSLHAFDPDTGARRALD